MRLLGLKFGIAGTERPVINASTYATLPFQIDGASPSLPLPTSVGPRNASYVQVKDKTQKKVD
jgi:hypothetical protein